MIKKIKAPDGKVLKEIELMDYAREYEIGAFVIKKYPRGNNDMIRVRAKSGLMSFEFRGGLPGFEPYDLLNYGVVNEDWRPLVESYLLNIYGTCCMVAPSFQRALLTLTCLYTDAVKALPENTAADEREIKLQQSMTEAMEQMKEIFTQIKKEEKKEDGSKL